MPTRKSRHASGSTSTDFDAAFEELDARYLAGEAAAHAQTWRVITRALAALNRREMPTMTTDYTIVDHQLRNEANSVTEYVHAAWDLTPDLRAYIEAVHRLSDLGGVVTLVSNGTSQEGFDAEWRIVLVITREGDAGKSCELFDETDLGTALARFDELSTADATSGKRGKPGDDRLLACFAARDWDAIAEILAEDCRQMTTAVRWWMRVSDVVGMPKSRTCARSPTIGHRTLTSDRHRHPRRTPRPRSCIASHAATSSRSAFVVEVLSVTEIDADDRIAAVVAFDPDDIDAAFEELDARYLAGEAAAHAHTWSVIAAGVRRIQPARTPRDDAGLGEHRPPTGLTFAPGDMIAYHPCHMGPHAGPRASTSRLCIG